MNLDETFGRKMTQRLRALLSGDRVMVTGILLVLKMVSSRPGEEQVSWTTTH